MLKPVTFIDLLSRIENDFELTTTKRRDLISATRTFARVLNLSLDHDRVGIQPYRLHLASFEPGRADMSSKRWANIRSDYRFALERYGLQERRPRLSDLSPDWHRLHDQATQTDIRLVRGLSGFIHFCNREGVGPDAVTDQTVEAHHQYLLAETTNKRPNRVHQRTCVLWNRASGSILSWPRILLKVPCYQNNFSLPFSAFPLSFQNDLQRWLDRLAGKDLLANDAPDQPLRPSTLRTKRDYVRRFASALILSGSDISKITSLADLVDRVNYTSAIQFLLDRAGGVRATGLYEQVATMVGLAKHWVGLPAEHLKDLKSVARKLKCRKPGLTDKNRARLRPFDDPLIVLKLMELPGILLVRAKQHKHPRKAALLVQTALAIRLLTVAPIRLQNLLTLRLDKHLVFSRPGRHGIVHLVLPPEEVKNSEPWECELAGKTVELLNIYVEKYLPTLSNGPAVWLFPGEKGGHKHSSTLSGKITKTILRELGIYLHVHGFRHLAAKRLLEEAPGDYPTASWLLGHKSIQTTMSFYSGFQSKAAARRYDEIVLKAGRSRRPRKRRSR